MEIVIIVVASACASLVALFSGFGLGTLLTPVFVLFFPIEIAIALTGIVHFLTNLFKLGLLGKYARWAVVLRFGIPSIAGAFIGARLLVTLTHFDPFFQYHLFGAPHSVEPVKLIVAVLMVYFALAEMIPKLQSFAPSESMLPAGGALSGFFGGLSGHQGALRSIFLLRYGMPKEQFLATGVVIACLVDITRLSLYSADFLAAGVMRHSEIILIAVCSAFLGAYIGSRSLKKVSHSFVQKIVAVFLLLIAVGVGSGIL